MNINSGGSAGSGSGSSPGVAVGRRGSRSDQTRYGGRTRRPDRNRRRPIPGRSQQYVLRHRFRLAYQGRKFSPGHASLAILPNSSRPEDGYVSFAPAKPGSVYGLGEFFDFEEDLDHYVKSSDDGPRGIWIGKIYGLDQHKMLRHFSAASMSQTYSPTNEFPRDPSSPLSPASVAETNLPVYGRGRSIVPIWSPDDVEDYARSIIAGTRKLGSVVGIKVRGAGTMF